MTEPPDNVIQSQLAILDAAVDIPRCPRGAFVDDDDYAGAWNLPGPGLVGDGLLALLDEMEASGLLESTEESKTPVWERPVTPTHSGQEFWEDERNADWSTYLVYNGGALETETDESFLSQNPDLCWLAFAINREVGLLPTEDMVVTSGWSTQPFSYGLREFSRVFKVHVTSPHTMWGLPDRELDRRWARLSVRQQWWRSACELLRFNRLGYYSMSQEEADRNWLW